jgi:diazepam-binding inhibitor (GABA receptor modulating acyl-CoA-binding protein)
MASGHSAQDDFDKAAEEAKALPDQTSNDDKLVLYGLFKQGTVGDVNTGKPGIWDPKGAH